MHDIATNCRRAAEGAADAVPSDPGNGCGFFTKSAFHDGFPLYLELADEGTIVAILCTENVGSHNDEEDAMRWPLFTWILAGGNFRDVLVCVSFDQATREALEAGSHIR